MRIDLEELVLCVPGLSTTDARTLGERVARRLGERLVESPSLRADLGGLDLRLNLTTASVDALVDPITDAILARLR